VRKREGGRERELWNLHTHEQRTNTHVEREKMLEWEREKDMASTHIQSE
jgi:hypothetical protein